MEKGVPLLPIIEVLPWDPNDTISLIRAIIRADRLREMYPGGVISLENLSQLRMPDDTGQYKALFDFLIYSLEYRVFAGNVFAKVRADFGNKLCVIAQNRQSAFLGPFSSFSENFYRQIAGEMGPKYKTVYPACQISDELLRSYQELKTDLNAIPFLATIQSCLTTAGSLRECLANDDVATSCADQPCTSKPSEGTLFEIYDDSFSEIVARKENKLAEISTIRPDECPELRDTQEEREFVLWWLAHANKILTEPAQCLSTAWQSNYFRSLDEERKTFACAEQRGIRDIQDPLGVPTVLDTLYKLKCGGTVNVSKTDIGKTLYYIFDQSEHLSIKLERARAFIGSRETDAIISALQKFARLKQAICGTLDEKSCVEEYAVWQNFPGLASQASGFVDASIFNGSPRQILENLTKLDNILVDMGICDLLQDKEFSTRTGYDRETYCDDHGLKAYQLVGSKALGHSIERGEVSSNGGTGYFYNSHGSSSRSMVKVPLGN